jgi:hypothetical protein
MGVNRGFRCGSGAAIPGDSSQTIIEQHVPWFDAGREGAAAGPNWNKLGRHSGLTCLLSSCLICRVQAKAVASLPADAPAAEVACWDVALAEALPGGGVASLERGAVYADAQVPFFCCALVASCVAWGGWENGVTVAGSETAGLGRAGHELLFLP